MKKFFAENFTHIVQSIFVLLSVLLSFYIDSIRVGRANASYKNELVKDIQNIIENERLQIKNIHDLQIKCRNAADGLIFDITQIHIKYIHWIYFFIYLKFKHIQNSVVGN